MSRLHRGRRILKQRLAEKAVSGLMGCGCGDCEAMMQPYLDGMLSDDEVAEAREHLGALPAAARSATASRSTCATSCGSRPTSRCPRSCAQRLAGLRSSPPAAQL